MKILFITFFVPYPPTAGHTQRDFNIIRQLAKDNEIFLLCFNQKILIPNKAELDNSIKHLSQYCSYIKVFKIPTDYSALKWYSYLFFNLFTITPFTVWKFGSKELRRELKALRANNCFDLVHIDTVELAGYAKLLENTPKLLNHHNVESRLIFRRGANAANPLAKLYLYLQGLKLQLFEKRMLDKFDMNACVSENDQEYLAGISPKARFTQVPNGTDIDYFKPSGEKLQQSLVFAGSMSWYPNGDAMIYFCSEVLPLIKKEFPDIRCDIIGSHPPSRLQTLAARDKSIQLHGYVDDVRKYIAKASVYIVPIRVGGGTRLKILDAFASGKAVVSTSIGCEGLAVTNGENIIIADKPDEFAKQVMELLKNETLRKKLEINGRKLVEKQYSWEIIVNKLNHIYRHLRA